MRCKAKKVDKDELCRLTVLLNSACITGLLLLSKAEFKYTKKITGQNALVYAMTSCRGVAALFLNLGARHMLLVNVTPRPQCSWGSTPVPTE
jgi:hypothetical protein